MCVCLQGTDLHLRTNCYLMVDQWNAVNPFKMSSVQTFSNIRSQNNLVPNFPTWMIYTFPLKRISHPRSTKLPKHNIFFIHLIFSGWKIGRTVRNWLILAKTAVNIGIWFTHISEHTGMHKTNTKKKTEFVSSSKWKNRYVFSAHI